MTNLAKPAKMSNTAFFLPRCRFSRPFPLIFLFSSIFLDSPRFSSILLDSPRFSSILLDSPRFSSILLDSPRFSSILLDSPRFFDGFRLLFVGKSNTNFATCAIFSPFSIFGGLSSPQLDILHTFEPFSSKNCKIAFFWQKVPLCIIFGPLPQKLATLVVFAQMDLSLRFSFPK